MSFLQFLYIFSNDILYLHLMPQDFYILTLTRNRFIVRFFRNNNDNKNETGELYYRHFSYSYRCFFSNFDIVLNAMTQNPILLARDFFITILYYKLADFSCIFFWLFFFFTQIDNLYCFSLFNFCFCVTFCFTWNNFCASILLLRHNGF